MKNYLLNAKNGLLLILSILIFSCETNPSDDENNIENFDLNVSYNEEQGEVIINPGRTTYEFGEEVYIKAIPKEGYVFSGWEGIVSESDDLTILVEKDYDITAVFEKENTNNNSGGDSTDDEHAEGTGPITLVMCVEHNLHNPLTITYNDGSGIQRVSTSDQLVVWTRTIKISREFDFLIEVSGTSTISGNFTIKINATEGDKTVYTYNKTYAVGFNSNFKTSVKDIVFSD